MYNMVSFNYMDRLEIYIRLFIDDFLKLRKAEKTMNSTHMFNRELNILLYQNGDYYFLLDLNGFMFAEIDYLYYLVLANWDGDNDTEVCRMLLKQFPENTVREVFLELRKSMKEMGLFQKLPEQKKGQVPSLMWFHLTDYCNLRCRYCFNHEGKVDVPQRMMSLETAKKAVDYFFSICEVKYTYFHFIGGEPLLNFEVIKGIVLYIEEQAQKCGIGVEYIITTNGLGINHEVAQFFKEHKFAVVISIDGNEECQNENRPLPGGQESYDQVIRGYEILREYLSSVTAKVTLTRQTIGKFYEIKQHLHQLGFRSVSYQLVVSSMPELVVNEEDIPPFINILEKIADNFIEDLKESKYIDKFMGWMEKIYKTPFNTGCAFTNFSKVVVDPDGYLYTCEMAVGDKNFIVGDIEAGINLNKYNLITAPTLENRPVCKDCWLRRYCDGGCYYFSYLQAGDFDHPNPVVCKEIEQSFLVSLKVFTSLYIQSPRILEYFFGNAALSREEIELELKSKD